jgi:hypothetical protein
MGASSATPRPSIRANVEGSTLRNTLSVKSIENRTPQLHPCSDEGLSARDAFTSRSSTRDWRVATSELVTWRICMRANIRFVIVGAFVFMCPICAPSQAQSLDPRGPLLQLIQAFQVCGPPQVFQMLSPSLYEQVVLQTSNTGCYPQIRQAGPVVDAQVIGQQNFPVGPVFMVRVAHQSGQMDWFIGFNSFTGKVELLSYQPAANATSIESGPSSRSKGPSSTPRSPSPQSSGEGDSDDGCKLYPAMCQ